LTEALRYVVGTAGHIDHGKTQLVRALTGVDADRLPEEKERGITIDIGFASLDLGPSLRLAFIDVPGHERFVKNMLAGVGGIDVALLVVAADESIKPQTREHFDICTLLGVRSGVVALTKVDLVPADLRELVELEVREFLQGSPLAEAPIVAVSSRTGEGIDALKESLGSVVAGIRPRDASGVPRLPVDRSFTIRGFGTVVTGTMLSGTIRTGDELTVYPHGRSVRIRRVEVHGQEAAQAVAGERAALNVQGADVSDVPRGTLVAAPDAFRPSRLVDARIRLLPTAPMALKNLARVRYHQGTAEIMARVKLLGARQLEPGEEGSVQLRLEGSQVSLPGDRFILRRYSPPLTIGGGEVLDPVPEKHRGAAAAVQERLVRFAAADLGDRLILVADDAGSRGCTVADLQVRTGVPRVHLAPVLQAACEGERLVRVGEGQRALYVTTNERDRLKAEVVSHVTAYHEAHPLEAGLGKEEIRGRVFGKATVDLFRHVLETLEGDGAVVVQGDRVRSATHRLTLSAEEERARSTIEERYRQGGLNPPALEEIYRDSGVSTERAEALYHVLVRDGRLVRVPGGFTYHCDAISQLIERLLNFRHKSETIDIAAFKELSGTTRKNAIPLLEYLDAERVTQRRGSARVIMAPRGHADNPRGGSTSRVPGGPADR